MGGPAGCREVCTEIGMSMYQTYFSRPIASYARLYAAMHVSSAMAYLLVAICIKLAKYKLYLRCYHIGTII